MRGKHERRLILFLRGVGGVALLAFFAAVMPRNWIIETSEFLGFDPFPDSPLTFYLARNLSLLYGFVGAALVVIASDLGRYRPLAGYAAAGTLAFGFLQLIVDAQASLPVWWTLGESLTTIFGGTILWWLNRNASQESASG